MTIIVNSICPFTKKKKIFFSNPSTDYYLDLIDQSWIMRPVLSVREAGCGGLKKNDPQREWPSWSRCGLVRGSLSLYKKATRSLICSSYTQ